MTISHVKSKIGDGLYALPKQKQIFIVAFALKFKMKTFWWIPCIVVFAFFVEFSETKKVPCPPLHLTPGAVISCENPKESKKVPCTGPIYGVRKGTIAKYKCEGDSDFSETRVQCRCYGKWEGLEDFQSYTSACATAQKKFSLDGPSELNLNKEQIIELDGNNATSMYNTTEPAYVMDTLGFHNYYRRLHNATLLQLNDTLSAAAQRWAEIQVSNDTFQPEPASANKTYISNMYELTIGSDDFDLTKASKLAVGKWYASGSNYDYEVPSANAFSAMIWNSTTDIGVGIASRFGNVVVVCNYWPPGNIYVVGVQNAADSLSLFKKNVFPKL